jgi:hypothetical protein
MWVHKAFGGGFITNIWLYGYSPKKGITLVTDMGEKGMQNTWRIRDG